MEDYEDYVNALPCDINAEAAVLNSCFLSKSAMDYVADWVQPIDFFDVRHQHIWVAMKRIYDRGESVNTVSVISELNTLHTLEEAGSMETVTALASMNYLPDSIETYAKGVRRLAQWRQLIDIGQQISNLGFQRSDTAVEDAQNLLMNSLSTGANNTATVIGSKIGEAVAGLHDALSGKLLGVTTGLPLLNKLTRGLRKKYYTLLAARPSVGKTALALNIALAAARSGVPVAIFSLEMDTLSLIQRLILSVTGGDLSKEGVQRAEQRIANLPIFIDETSRTLSAIKATARRLHSQGFLGLIIIDYLQLIAPDAKGRRSSRNEEVTEVSGELKAMAKQFDVPLLALCQLSRAPESTHSKKPQMSHLRDSGSLEQDADVVLLLHRSTDSYGQIDEDTGEPDNTCDIIVAKNRNGETGTVNTVFKGEQQRFYEVVQDR